jgi:hypothetical protein
MMNDYYYNLKAHLIQNRGVNIMQQRIWARVTRNVVNTAVLDSLHGRVRVTNFWGRVRARVNTQVNERVWRRFRS